MDAEIAEVVARIHDTPEQAVLAVAGAGNYALAWLLGVGGASRTVLETRVPYGYLAMIDFLGGFAPEQTVSADTARRIARAAWQRGIVTSRVRRSDNRSRLHGHHSHRPYQAGRPPRVHLDLGLSQES